jgi:putative colanic acid biosynthesis UDP-glucose lipid carrier transferase
MTVSEPPIVALFKRLLDPLIIAVVLAVIVWAFDAAFAPYYLLLMAAAFFAYSFSYEIVNRSDLCGKGHLPPCIKNMTVSWFVAAGILTLLGHAFLLTDHYSREILIAWFTVVPVILVASHFVVLGLTRHYLARGWARSAVIVGLNEGGVHLIYRTARYPHLLIKLQGYFDDRDENRTPDTGMPCLGDLSMVAEYVRQQAIQMVFVDLPMTSQPRILELLDDLHDTTASIFFLPDVNISDLMRARNDQIDGVSIVAICETPLSGFDIILKRISDIVLGALMLVLLMPLMTMIAVAIKLTSPGPIIFKQHRYGLNGEPILVWKFRSMTVCEDGAHIAQAQQHDARVTKVGQFLRRSSLDELPQLINVLQGSMSIVGPRPHAVIHNELYRKLIRSYMMRHKMKPGITGWAQVNGWRGETEVVEKMARRIEFDLDYMRNWSIGLDLWILMRTVWVVLRRNNAY